ncbi:MAG: hypothetical protein AAFR11_06360 [Pseudomonadota bacterium]
MSIRIVQWATGAMGKTCLRRIIDHPDLDLAGLFVYSAGKAGRDAGDIARRDPTGVIATASMDQILALDADLVVHAARLAPPYGSHDDEIMQLLRSGKDVISINGYTFPSGRDAAARAALEAAAIEGGATLAGAGLNPGFAMEKIAAVASSVCDDVRCIHVIETVPCQEVKSPAYVFDILGFGSDPGVVDPNAPDWGPSAALNGMFAEPVRSLAQSLGLTLQTINTDHAVFPATEDLAIAAGEILKGRTARLRWRWRGETTDGVEIVLEIRWEMEPSPADEAIAGLWRVSIDGAPGIDMTIDLTKRQDDPYRTSAEQLGVAAAVVNAIPAVRAAPPGLMNAPIATPWRPRFQTKA